MAQFPRQSVSGGGFTWYGVLGQGSACQRPAAINFLNQNLFAVVQFPGPAAPTGCAVAASVFVIRFLRSFEVDPADRNPAGAPAGAEQGQDLRLLEAGVTAQKRSGGRSPGSCTTRPAGADRVGMGLRGRGFHLRQDTNRASLLRELEDWSTEV
jgi:hypothetical protein